MAAFSHHRGASRSTQYNDGYRDEQEQAGSCKYRDLSLGSNALTCSCQRFCLNGSYLNAAWCFCGHHYCFHETPVQALATTSQAPVLSREIRHEHEGYTDNTHLSGYFPAGSPQKAPAGLGIRPSSRSGSSNINARVWQALNGFARQQEDGVLSDTTSKLPSTAAPSVAGDTAMSPPRPAYNVPSLGMRPPVHIPATTMPRTREDYSATEVATPSVAGTPDFKALAPSSTPAVTSPGYLKASRFESGGNAGSLNVQPPAMVSEALDQRTPMEVPRASTEALEVNPTEDLREILRGYRERLEALESLSFSHVPAEEIHDKFELIDLRMLDLEQWRTEQENQLASPEIDRRDVNKRRRLEPEEDDSPASSNASFDSNAAAHAETAVLATLAANAETHPRIDALEERVADLENATPSFARPWQVQVVLLPWGRSLRGIWFSPIESTQHSMRASKQPSQEWTGAQSLKQTSFTSSVDGWTTESIEAWANDTSEWLSPKACGPGGMVFQRLASRGMVREVAIRAPDARHISGAIADAFDGIVMQKEEREQDADVSSRFQGLRESFVPLRKVRKSSRLRFLSPAEMITSATWDASYLDSSIFMKVADGQRRMYITTPESYTQGRNDGWTWAGLRALPIWNASIGEQEAQASNAVVESCWTFNETLDAVSSAHSSFAFAASEGSVHSAAIDAQSDDALPRPVSPMSEAHSIRHRTVSFPSSMSANARLLEVAPKRRVASFDPSTTIPVDAYGTMNEPVAKRRRISNSSEAQRQGVGLTPRYSREPPSPFMSDLAAESKSQGTSDRRRGNTPFAYATPHSNSNYISRMEFLGADGDTEANTEVMADVASRVGEEEAWEGVDDDTNLGSIGQAADTEIDDDI